jgi:SAM-dependent methyltransferase
MTPHSGSYLDRVRYAELCSVRSLFPDSGSVLEIGGGNGYQAAVLKSWGLQVVSIDVDTQGIWTERYFDVTGYDGKTLPVADRTVDVIFSSNVLEHIAEDALQALLTEMRRALAPGGFAVHLVPTPVWRLWTIMAHYPWLILRVIRRTSGGEGMVQPSVASVIQRRGLRGLLKRALWPAPHGEYPSSFAELFAFRERAWRERFDAGGFTVTQCYPAGIFYTGYTLLPRLPMSWRRFMSKLLGSACKVYVVKPTTPSGGNNGSL